MKKFAIILVLFALPMLSCGLSGVATEETAQTILETEPPVEAVSDETEPAEEAVPDLVITQEPVEPVTDPAFDDGAWMEIPESLAFFDNFQTGSADRWQAGPGWTVQQEGDLYFFETTQQGLSFVKGIGEYQNYLLRGQVFLESGTMAMSIYLSSTGRYLLAYNNEGLYILKEIFDTGEIVALASTAPPSLNQWHWMGIAVENGHLQAGVDSELLMDVIDPAPLTGGSVGMGAGEDSHVRVDNIAVTLLEGPLITPGELVQEEDVPVPEEIAAVAEAPEAPPLEVDAPPEEEAPPEEAVPPEEEVEEPEAEDEAPDPEAEETEEPEADPEGPEIPAVCTDVYVKGVSIPKPWLAGEPLTITVKVSNKGPDAAGAFTVAWYPFADEVVGGSADVPGLAVEEVVTLTFEYPGYPESGAVTWVAVADAERELSDPMLGNNTLTGSMVIESPVALLPAADLVFIYQGGNDPDAGEIYDAHFVVSNWGPETSPAFNVEWYPFSTNIVGGSWEVPPLAVGEEADLEMRFDGYVDVGEYTWTLKIDPAGEVNDPDRTNNVFSNGVTVE